jgi:hypothetical protein
VGRKNHGDVGGGLTRSIALRVTQQVFEAFDAKVEAAGTSRSKFFRDAVLSNQTTVIARIRATGDKRRLLYLANKSSNNLNQLAHRAHLDHVAGSLSEATYQKILANLQQIARSLNSAASNVD